MAARLLLAATWKSEDIPTGEDWIQKVHYMCLTDRIMALLQFREGKVNATEL